MLRDVRFCRRMCGRPLCRATPKREPVGTLLPDTCPECGQDAFWVVEPLPLTLTRDDRIFLRVNRIRPEW